MKDVLISVIIPVYNCEQYLDRCFQSLVAQTLAHIEFIVINNGSTDNSAHIIKKYAENDNRFLYFEQEKGLQQARNRGLQEAHGQYIGFVDADDYVEPNMFELLYHSASKNHSDVVICDYSHSFKRTPDQPNILQLAEEKVCETRYLPRDRLFLRYFCRYPTIWNKIYRREIIKQNSICFESNYGEDLFFNIRFLEHLEVLSLVPYSLYHYFQSDNSVTRKINTNNQTFLQNIHHFISTIPAQETSLLPYYEFSSVIVCFLFSSYVAGENIQFFYRQFRLFKQWPLFSSYAQKLCSNQLAAMLEENAISHRFYMIQKIAFFLYRYHLDWPAAFFLWGISKVIYVKTRKL